VKWHVERVGNLLQDFSGGLSLSALDHGNEAGINRDPTGEFLLRHICQGSGNPDRF
jgi:hypothetical protein